MKKRNGLLFFTFLIAIAMVMIILVAQSDSATIWNKMSANPYTGNAGTAAPLLTRWGLSKNGVEEITRCFRERRFVIGEPLKVNEQFLGMISGDKDEPKLDDNVIVGKNVAAGNYRTQDCKYGEFVVRHVPQPDCNNFLIAKRARFAVPATPPQVQIPSPGSAPARFSQIVASKSVEQYSFVIDFFLDTKDGFWRRRFETLSDDFLARFGDYDRVSFVYGEVANLHTTYFKVFHWIPFGQLRDERKARPISGGIFYVNFLKEPVQIHKPHPGNIVKSITLTTNQFGYAHVPLDAIPITLENFSIITIRPDERMDMLGERFIWDYAETFRKQVNPIHYWNTQSQK